MLWRRGEIRSSCSDFDVWVDPIGPESARTEVRGSMERNALRFQLDAGRYPRTLPRSLCLEYVTTRFERRVKRVCWNRAATVRERNSTCF